MPSLPLRDSRSSDTAGPCQDCRVHINPAAAEFQSQFSVDAGKHDRPADTMSSECIHCCCYCCLQCCNLNNKGEKYASIEYSDPGEEAPLMNAPNTELPPEKIYHFPQPGAEFSLPLYPTLSLETITEQPISDSDETRSKAMTLPKGFRLSEVQMLEQFDNTPSPFQRSDSERTKGGWTPQLPVLAEERQSSLQFSLYYDAQRRTMTVNLKKAIDLPAKDQSGTSDPFVVLYLVPNKEEMFESNIVHKTLDPIFDQTFEFHNLDPDDIRRQSIVFRICHHSKDDVIGDLIVPLEDADLYGVPYTMRIDERVAKSKPNLESEGDLHLSLSYYPTESILKGVILKATNLTVQGVSGLADPYVKVYLVYQGRRIARWKSNIKRNTLIAVFNEPFQFDLEKRDINKVSLEVLLMNYDRFSRNHLIGIVLLGVSVEHRSGRSHWTEVIATPQQSISQWHTIKPVQPQEASKRKISYT